MAVIGEGRQPHLDAIDFAWTGYAVCFRGLPAKRPNLDRYHSDVLVQPQSIKAARVAWIRKESRGKVVYEPREEGPPSNDCSFGIRNTRGDGDGTLAFDDLDGTQEDSCILAGGSYAGVAPQCTLYGPGYEVLPDVMLANRLSQ